MSIFYKPRNRRGEPLPPVRERLAAFKHIPPFLRMVWATKPIYGAGIVLVRLANAFTPVAMLWVGKLIIDTVVENIGAANPDWGLLAQLVALELAIALLSDVLGRLSGLLESLLGDLFSNEMSVRLMRHATTLDLQHFEDPDFFDKMQRARRQTMGRVALMSQVLTMGQQAVTLVSLLAALIAFNGWLLVILIVAILPSFLGETAYAGIAYSFMFQWTQQRRELDYYRWDGSPAIPRSFTWTWNRTWSWPRSKGSAEGSESANEDRSSMPAIATITWHGTRGRIPRGADWSCSRMWVPPPTRPWSCSTSSRR